jgi:hypothetical protein
MSGIDLKRSSTKTTPRRDSWILIRMERFGHLFFGFGLAAGFWLWQQNGYTPHARFNELLAAAVNVASIGAGFLGTMVALLLSLDDRPVLRLSKQSAAYPRLVTYLFSAVAWCFVTAVFSALGALHDFKDNTMDSVGQALFCGWIGVSVAAAISTARVIVVMREVLRIVSKQEE